MAYSTTRTASHERNPLDRLRRFTALALAELTHTNPRFNEKKRPLAVVCSSEESVNADSPGRQPFGLVFRDGQRAAFDVPPGRRFVVEYLNITCWGMDPRLLVQLTTRSREMFRNLTLCSLYDELSSGNDCRISPASPLSLWESTANTFLFSFGDLRPSAMVPADTCVQMWGYLEPTSFRTA